MKKTCIPLLTISFVILLAITVSAGEKAPQKVIDFANNVLIKLGEDPVIIDAVKAQNAKGKTLSQIKAMDKKWRNTPGIADYMKALMNSECAKHIQNIQKSKSYYAEIFVMDNQGANVAMTDKTSDYWQGDEAKFNNSFNNGNGKVFIDDIEFDDSAQAYLVQISIPVKDNGKTIGAITIGLDIDKME